MRRWVDRLAITLLLLAFAAGTALAVAIATGLVTIP